MGAVSSVRETKGTTMFAQLLARYANWFERWPTTWPWSIGSMIFLLMLGWAPVWFGTTVIVWYVLSGVVVFAYERRERRAEAGADPAASIDAK